MPGTNSASNQDPQNRLSRSVDKLNSTCELLGARFAALEGTTKELQKILFTGNGQPSIVQQLAHLGTKLDEAVSDIKEIGRTKIGEHRLRNAEQVFDTKLQILKEELNSIRSDQNDFEKDSDRKDETKAMTRTQYMIAIMGGALGILAAIITAIASIVGK